MRRLPLTLWVFACSIPAFLLVSLQLLRGHMYFRNAEPLTLTITRVRSINPERLMGLSHTIALYAVDCHKLAQTARQ
jgi:hypothetical protein